MTNRWEYIVAYLDNHTNDPNVDEDVRDWSNFTYYSPGNPQRVGLGGFSLADALAIFGEDGWELVSETIVSTTLTAGLFGWKTVAQPVRTRFIFKRPVS